LWGLPGLDGEGKSVKGGECGGLGGHLDERILGADGVEFWLKLGRRVGRGSLLLRVSSGDVGLEVSAISVVKTWISLQLE
jgi:hypothetical protein